MGGYVASTALRAAGAHTEFPRPASLVGHFLGVAAFGPVEITTATLRRAKKAESVRVVGHPAGDARVRGARVGGRRRPRRRSPMRRSRPAPRRVVPTTTRRSSKRLAAAGLEPDPPFPFWTNFEGRPLDWIDDPSERVPGAAEWGEWLRFLPDPDTRDPWIDAGDSWCSSTSARGLRWCATTSTPRGMYAPSIDLACHFHRLRPDSQYLLAHGTSPSGADGLITSHQSVWADDGTFLASGISQLLCRPAR